MNNTEQLLKKYSKPYVPGEKRSTEYEKMIKRQQRQEHKKQIAEDLFQEVPFHLTNDEKEQVLHLITMYNNFRDLHGKASNETIILAFIFYVKMNNKQIKIDRYTITEKYQLTHTTFEIIVCRLVKNYLKHIYIIPKQSETKQHDIITKGDVK